MKTRWIRILLVIAFAIVTAFGVIGTRAAITQPSLQLSEIPSVLPALQVETLPSVQESISAAPAASLFTTTQLADAYDAGKRLRKAAGDLINAVHALREGQVAGVDLTVEQMESIKEEGLGGLIRTYRRWENILGILEISQAQLVNWETTHPQPEPCYESLNNCPEPEPEPTSEATITPTATQSATSTPTG